MKSINFKILAVVLFFILIIVVGKSVFAKYLIKNPEALIIEVSLDRTPPKLDVSYSNTKSTNGDVTVTIKANEKVQKPEGWDLSEDKMTLTKTFEDNISEDVKIYDLAGNSSTAKININNIDKIKPTVECTEIKNSNTKYPLYANSEKEINLTIKVSDNIQIKDVDLTKVNIKVGSNNADLTKKWTEKTSNNKEKVYNLKLTNIKGDGILTVEFEEGFVTDTATNINNIATINTKINIDNTKPTVSCSKDTISQGKINTVLTANEKIQEIEGWEMSEDGKTLTKIFENNASENVEVFDLAGNSNIVDINISDIDKIKPTVECTEIKNSNTKYPLYANSQKEINLTIKVSDNIQIKDVDLTKVNIKVGSNNADLTKKWTETTSNNKEKIYNLKLTNIKGDGVLTVEFEEGFVTDTATNINDIATVNTQINIDNTKPTVSYSQSIIEQGKVNAIVTANEKIQKPEGWDISSDSKELNKEFVSNVSYNLTISDLAGNETTTEISVTGAKYINLIYASHNSEVGWTFGHGNYDIAGADAIKIDSKYKTEALAFNVSGNIESDFVQAKAYVYTHWGVGSYGRCRSSGLLYNYGYNPDNGLYKSMTSNDLVTIEDKKYFQLGGSGVNCLQATDINGNNPIPQDIASSFHYGICGLTLTLKDYTDYSIIYQIYVSEVGWQPAVSNGTETMYSKTKPISALRVVLVPSSEKQNVINTWNQDIGKFIK